MKWMTRMKIAEFVCLHQPVLDELLLELLELVKLVRGVQKRSLRRVLMMKMVMTMTMSLMVPNQVLRNHLCHRGG
jgi:hypothetical protein